MASLHRTIARNIAREQLIASGAQHIHRKRSISGDNRTQFHKRSYLITAQSILGQLWRKLSSYPAAKAKRTPREARTRMKSSKGGSIA